MDDLISRQMTIDAINKQIDQCNRALASFDIDQNDEYAIKVERASLVAYRDEVLKYLPSVQPELAKYSPTLANENGDLISRQAAIDSIRECAEAARSNHEWDMEQGYLNAIECIEEEPSTQPELANNSPKLANENDELISRQAAIDAVYESAVGKQMLRGHKDLVELLMNLPSAQPSQAARDIATIIENEKDMRVVLKEPERKKGKWIENHTTCSKCGWQMIDDVLQTPNMIGFNFCPNCGAKMEEGGQDG